MLAKHLDDSDQGCLLRCPELAVLALPTPEQSSLEVVTTKASQ